MIKNMSRGGVFTVIVSSIALLLFGVIIGITSSATIRRQSPAADGTVFASVTGGSCGKNGDPVYYDLDDSGNVRIYGNGDMDDYEIAGHVNPFTFVLVKTVSIESGVTRIGDMAFMGTSIDEIIIPSSVQSLGLAAFADICTDWENPGLQTAGPRSIVIEGNSLEIGVSTFFDGEMYYGDFGFTREDILSGEGGVYIYVPENRVNYYKRIQVGNEEIAGENWAPYVNIIKSITEKPGYVDPNADGEQTGVAVDVLIPSIIMGTIVVSLVAIISYTGFSSRRKRRI
jgi:hypothetical protein